MSERFTNEGAPFPRGRNTDWQRDALERAVRLYPGWPDRGGPRTRYDSELARTLRLDPCIIQYLETAPVLRWSAATRAVRTAMLRREKLAKVMRAATLAPALRRVSGKDVAWCDTVHGWKHLSRANNSLIAQALHALAPTPTKTDSGFKRRDGLRWMHQFAKYAILHEKPDILDWALRKLVQEGGEEHKFTDGHQVLDFIHRGDVPFNVTWTLHRTWLEIARWHKRLADMKLGDNPDDPADYGDLPLKETVDRYIFRALRTVRQLHTEGREMNHCVASYAEDVFFSQSRIYAIHETALPAERATLEIYFYGKNDAWTVEQVKGPYNRTPSATLLAAVETFVRKINEARG